MSEQEKAIVRACLDQVVLGMTESREVKSWWESLSDERRQEWKVFAASVSLYRRTLTEDFLNRTLPLCETAEARPCKTCGGSKQIPRFCHDPNCGDSTYDHACDEGWDPCPDCLTRGEPSIPK
jgi:hypothetical protein